jgi:hypothetical protein
VHRRLDQQRERLGRLLVRDALEQAVVGLLVPAEQVLDVGAPGRDLDPRADRVGGQDREASARSPPA